MSRRTEEGKKEEKAFKCYFRNSFCPLNIGYQTDKKPFLVFLVFFVFFCFFVFFPFFPLFLPFFSFFVFFVFCFFQKTTCTITKKTKKTKICYPPPRSYNNISFKLFK